MIFEENLNSAPSVQSHIFENVFPNHLLSKDGYVKTKEALSDRDFDLVGILFHSSSFPLSTQFKDLLVKKYRKINLNYKRFEIVFVSADISQQQFNDNYQTMPWLALNYGDQEDKDRLIKEFKCFTAPYLVL